MKNEVIRIMKKTLITGIAILILVSALAGTALAYGKKSPDLMRGIRINGEMYMILLSEKYAPELVNEWKNEFTRRDTLIEELKKLREDKSGTDRIIQKLDEIKSKLDTIEEKIDKGEMTREEARREFGKGLNFPRERGRFYNMRDRFRKNWGPEMDKNRELSQQFNQAIESGDEAQIKAILPELLQQFKDMNQNLEKQINEMKNSKP